VFAGVARYYRFPLQTNEMPNMSGFHHNRPSQWLQKRYIVVQYSYSYTLLYVLRRPARSIILLLLLLLCSGLAEHAIRIRHVVWLIKYRKLRIVNFQLFFYWKCLWNIVFYDHIINNYHYYKLLGNSKKCIENIKQIYITL